MQKQNKYPVIIISGILRISKIKVTDVQIQIADPTFLAKKQFPTACEFYVFVISKNASQEADIIY